MFEIGREYHRKSEIHALYGGQAQSGISTPKQHSVIFIFISATGEQYGYKNEYRESGVFWLTGQGQAGDMKMAAGNKAILNHVKDNKTIYVFEYTKTAYVRYIGLAEYLGHHAESRHDTNDETRSAIVFHLDINSTKNTNKVEQTSPTYGIKNAKDLKKKNIRELRKSAVTQAPKNATKSEKLVITNYRSQAIKLYVIARSKGICEACKIKAPFETKNGPYLECHHLYRLADGGPDDPRNVIAVCPNCHRRAHFAKDSVSFNNKLKKYVEEIEKEHP